MSEDKFVMPILMDNGVSVEPVTSFEDGGIWFHFVQDDGCLVLCVPHMKGGYTWATHLFPRAQKALIKYLLENTNESL